MKNKFVEYFSRISPLSEEEAKGIEDGMCIKTFKKGTVLLKEGQLSVDTYFILEGCIREFIVIDGEDKTTNFFIKPPNLQIDKFINNFLQKSLSCKYGNTSQGELYHFTEINTILIFPQVLIWE